MDWLTDGAILVGWSFEIVKLIYKQLLYKTGLMGLVPIVLVANKVDLTESKVITSKEGIDLAKKWGANYIESSAQCNMNIAEIFTSVVTQYEKRNTPEKKKKRRSSILACMFWLLLPSGCDRCSRRHATLKMVVIDTILWVCRCVLCIDLSLLVSLLFYGWKMFKSLRKLSVLLLVYEWKIFYKLLRKLQTLLLFYGWKMFKCLRNCRCIGIFEVFLFLNILLHFPKLFLNDWCICVSIASSSSPNVL